MSQEKKLDTKHEGPFVSVDDEVYGRKLVYGKELLSLCPYSPVSLQERYREALLHMTQRCIDTNCPCQLPLCPTHGCGQPCPVQGCKHRQGERP